MGTILPSLNTDSIVSWWTWWDQEISFLICGFVPSAMYNLGVCRPRSNLRPYLLHPPLPTISPTHITCTTRPFSYFPLCISTSRPQRPTPSRWSIQKQRWAPPHISRLFRLSLFTMDYDRPTKGQVFTLFMSPRPLMSWLPSPAQPGAMASTLSLSVAMK